VNKIRKTSDNTLPVHQPRLPIDLANYLSAFDSVTDIKDEMLKIVIKAPSKHCRLDPVPAWSVKRLLPLLAETVTVFLFSATSTQRTMF